MAILSKPFRLANLPDIYVSVTDDDGVDVTGTTSSSTGFQSIVTNNRHVRVPPGTYLLKDISVPSNTVIDIDEGAILKGETTGDNIFATTGAITGVVVRGGQARDCLNFWSHTGNSALASSVFEGIDFRDLTAAFDLSSAVGVSWKSNTFGSSGGTDNIAYGIRFRKTGTGQTNMNNFFDNRYANYSVAGVSYDDSAVVAFSNNHYGDWFEDSTHSGLIIGGSVYGLNLWGGYFETTGSATEADVEINITTSTSTAIYFNGVTFNTNNATQTERIKSTGNCDFKAENCNVSLTTGCNFASVESATGDFHTQLYDNRLNAVGAGTYESRLFTKTSTQQVSWSVHVGSGLVTDDSYPMEISNKMVAGPWVTFANADATPSVRQGNRFKTAGTTTITDFDDGQDGQEIVVKAGNSITVIGVAMVLNDVAKFINDGGTWRHINK